MLSSYRNISFIVFILTNISSFRISISYRDILVSIEYYYRYCELL